MSSLSALHLTLPYCDRPETHWLSAKLQTILRSRWANLAEIVTPRTRMFSLLGKRPIVLVSASFVLREEAPWEYFNNLRATDRAVFYEEQGSGQVLAAAFPAGTNATLVEAWTAYLTQCSAVGVVPRPQITDTSLVLSESGSLSQGKFVQEANPKDDQRRARNLPAINQLLFEMMTRLRDESCLPEELEVARSLSSVPWLFNSLLNTREYQTRQERLRSAPPELHLSTTSACNIECRFCSYTHKKALFRYLDLPTFRQLEIYPWLETLRLSSGLGEPTINPHLPAILEYLGTQVPHLNLNLFTNALAWNNPGLIESFGHLSWLNASLNATSDTTWKDLCMQDGFARIRRNLLRLRRDKEASRRLLPRVHASIVLNSRNMEELADLPHLCAELGIVRLTAIPFFALGYEGGQKLGGDASLAACQRDYSAIFDKAVRAAEAAQITLEAPSSNHESDITYGLQARQVFDFAKLGQANIQIEQLLPETATKVQACPSLWRMAAIAAPSGNNLRTDQPGYLYPCLGPLASHDFSAEMPITYTGRAQFFDVWNGPLYRRLRAGQSQAGLNPTCDVCREADSRNPKNFARFLRLREEATADQLVQLQPLA